MRQTRTPGLLVLLTLALASTGCMRGCTSSRPPIHLNPNMDWQPKYEAQESSEFFYDGSAMRLPVPGTVARGQLREAHPIASTLADPESFFIGKDAGGQYLATNPSPGGEALLARGAERYAIYCRPCHTKRGNGKGIMTERGGVPVPSFHEQRILDLTEGEIFETITLGKGLMKGYGYPLPAEDRWAIIAHVRRLQQEKKAADAVLAASR